MTYAREASFPTLQPDGTIVDSQLIVGAGIYGDPLSMEFASFGNGADITSALVLVNVTPEPIRPAVYFYDTEGDPIAAESLVEVTGDLEVREDGGLTLGTAMASLGEVTIATHGQGEYVTGSVKVLSDAAIGGGLRFDMPGVGEAVVEASRPTGDAVFPVRRVEGGLNTGVAIHNQEYEPMEVMCRLMSGGAMLEEAMIPLASNGQASWLLDGAFPGADTSDFTGSVRCVAAGEGRFSAVVQEMDAGAHSHFLTVPVIPLDGPEGSHAAELDFTHFVNGDGVASDLVFVNMMTEPIPPPHTPFDRPIPPTRPALYFYDTGGQPIAAESVVDITGDLEIRGDGALTVGTGMGPLEVLTIATNGQGDQVTGSVKVVSEGPIAGMLRFDLSGIGEAVVGASPPMGDMIFPVRHREGGISTGIAIHNLDSSAGMVQCDLMREGTVVDSASHALEANQQMSFFLDQAFPGADTSNFTGSVRCMAADGGSFTGIGVELEAANRIFVSLPVFPVEEMTDQE